MKLWKTSLCAAVAILGAVSAANADVKPAPVFGDHMVLQQGMTLPVWGTADAGEVVTVDLNDGKSYYHVPNTATADADGKWRVDLPKEESGGPFSLTIKGGNSSAAITYSDVLIGEVWVGSGQSNMTFPVSHAVASYAGMLDEDKVIAEANYPQVRMFTGASTKALAPQTSLKGQWEVCSPATVPHFSAVGYLFARNLNRELKVPVGIVLVAEGASTAESWISRDAMAANAKLKPVLDRFDSVEKSFASGVTAAPPAPPTRPATTTRPARAARGGGSRDPVQDHHNPTVMYNGMIAPIIPYAMRGVIWYQGESIVGPMPGVALYPEVQATLIKDWRARWGEGNFPFYICQLAALGNSNSNSPPVREAQATVLSLPNTGMAVNIDIAEATNVHPKNKAPLGDRLAKIALANAYGQKIEYSGPMYDSCVVEGSSIRVKFTHASGLLAKGGPLQWFEIAGEDGKYVKAQATIDGSSVVVSSPEVTSPRTVRYAWDRYPLGANLYNSDDLPAAPFRSDAPVFHFDN